MADIRIINYNEDRYVWSKDLYQALELNKINYSKNLKAWFDKEYLFQGQKEFKKPVRNYDYLSSTDIEKKQSFHRSPQSISQVLGLSSYNHSSIDATPLGRGNTADSYLIRLEFAKLIALDSSSKLKKQFVQWLLSIEAKVEDLQLLSRTTLIGLMEMVKLCSYIDNQIEYYKNHKAKYFEFKEEDDSWDEFDKWRNSVLHLLTDADLTEEIIKLKGYKPKKGCTKVEKIAILDTLQSIRISLFDFLAHQLRPYTHQNLMRARDLADFVKKLFEAAGINRIEIKSKGFTDNGQLDLFRQIQEVDIKLISKTLRELQPA